MGEHMLHSMYILMCIKSLVSVCLTSDPHVFMQFKLHYGY